MQKQTNSQRIPEPADHLRVKETQISQPVVYMPGKWHHMQWHDMPKIARHLATVIKVRTGMQILWRDPSLHMMVVAEWVRPFYLHRLPAGWCRCCGADHGRPECTALGRLPWLAINMLRRGHSTQRHAYRVRMESETQRPHDLEAAGILYGLGLLEPATAARGGGNGWHNFTAHGMVLAQHLFGHRWQRRLVGDDQQPTYRNQHGDLIVSQGYRTHQRHFDLYKQGGPVTGHQKLRAAKQEAQRQHVQPFMVPAAGPEKNEMGRKGAQG